MAHVFVEEKCTHAFELFLFRSLFSTSREHLFLGVGPLVLEPGKSSYAFSIPHCFFLFSSSLAMRATFAMRQVYDRTSQQIGNIHLIDVPFALISPIHSYTFVYNVRVNELIFSMTFHCFFLSLFVLKESRFHYYFQFLFPTFLASRKCPGKTKENWHSIECSFQRN